MAVYFVYRCYYNAPGERHVRRFECDTVLDWFRSIWKPIPEEEMAEQYAKQLFSGLDAWMFGQMFLLIAEENLSPPESMDDVMDGFGRIYIPELNRGRHHVQFLLEDNDNQVAVYLFDDHFRAMHPGLTDFLLLEGWELPGTWSEAGPSPLPAASRKGHPGDGEGSVYAVSLFTDCKYNLDDLEGGTRVDNVRVPDLCRYVLTRPDESDLEYELRSLRRTLQDILAVPRGEDAGFLTAIRDNPAESFDWLVYSDWLQEHGLPTAGLYLLGTGLRAANPVMVLPNHNPSLDLIKVTPHMAQACKHEGRETPSFPGAAPRDSYSQWIFFDDLWVAANPTLAAGILRFAARWDVLSTGPREEDEG